MEETELEEGEACFRRKNGDDSANIDPDIALSYIDEKIQHVLGHFQKDFEGGVSVENLGAKFGGYGSFLPSHQQSSSIWSQPEGPEGVHVNGSCNNHRIEGATESSSLPSDAPLLGKHATASDSVKCLHSERLVSIDAPSKREPCLNSTRALRKLRIKHEASNKMGNFIHQKKFKIRIKLGSNDLMCKTATSCSGLGLDISPSTSNDADEIASLPLESRVISDESPTRILQIITTFPVPGSALLSPLGDKYAHMRKPGAHPEKQSFGIVKGKKKSDGDYPGKGVNKSKKHIGICRDNDWSFVDNNLEHLHKQRREILGLSDDDSNDFNMEDSEKDLCSPLHKSQVKTSEEVDGTSASVASLTKTSTDGLPITENGLPSEVVPSPTMVINENWVCCDSCGKWRLLPFGTMPEQLPETWLCSMLNWLPGMNRCDVSENETTKSVRALWQLPLAESLNNVNGHGAAARVNPPVNVQCLDHDLNSNTLSNRVKKNDGSRELLTSGKGQASVQILPCKKNPLDLRDSTVNYMEGPSLESPLVGSPRTWNSRKSYNSKVHKHETDKHMNDGDAKQVKMKANKQIEQYRNEASKRVRTECKSYNWNSNLGLGHEKADACFNKGLSAKAWKRQMQKYDNNCPMGNFKFNKNEKLLVSMNKVCEQGHFSSNSRSLETEVSPIGEVSLKRRKQNEWKESQNDLQLSQAGTQNFLNSRVPGMEECRSTGDDQKRRKHGGEVAGQQNLGGLNSLKRARGQISTAATSSSSKVFDSQKTKGSFEEVKGSPVVSVSSSPLRNANACKLVPVECSNLRKYRATDGEGNGEGMKSGLRRKPKLSAVSHLKSLKSPGLNLGDENPDCKLMENGKSSIEVSSAFGNSGRIKDGVCTIEGRQRQLKNLDALEYCNLNDGLDTKCSTDDLLSQQNSGQKSSLQCKEQDKSSDHHVYKDEAKRSLPLNEHEYARKRLRYEAEGKPQLSRSLVKCSLPNRDSIRPCTKEKNHVSDKDHTGMWVDDKRLEGQSMVGGHMNGKDNQQLDPNQNNDGERILNLIDAQGMNIQADSINGKSQSLLNHEGKQERVTRDCELPAEVQKGMCDVPKVPKQADNAATQNSTPNQLLLGDINDVAHMNKESVSQTTNCALKEAESLRDYADRLKCSGFGFESNEMYFQAALKFLDGASLLGTSDGNGKRHGEMSQMQMYKTAAKLCESCAHEYEKRQEMAAAALAYKCMEVAYMRIVYCRHFFTNTSRLQNGLQATLSMVPHGESPLSCASDVDNLNHQGYFEKAASFKHVGPYVAGTRCITENLDFVRLLDFVQDVNFAMEASIKSQNAFVAANVCPKEMHKKEFMAPVGKVIDFSFQDVRKLVQFVRLALESISH